MTSVIFLHEANRFSELLILFSRNGLPTGPVVTLIASVLPGILVFTLPVSILLGVLMGLGRMSADSEITALRASGVGRARLLVPLVLFGLGAAAVMTWLTFSLVPAAKTRLDALKEQQGD